MQRFRGGLAPGSIAVKHDNDRALPDCLNFRSEATHEEAGNISLTPRDREGRKARGLECNHTALAVHKQ
jgi:hypothetical protein